MGSWYRREKLFSAVACGGKAPMLVIQLLKCFKGCCDGTWKTNGGCQAGESWLLFCRHVSTGTETEQPYIRGYPSRFGTQRSQQSRFALYVALHSSTSNFRRVKQRFPAISPLKKVVGWRAWGCYVGASTLVVGLNILLMGLAMVVAASDNMIAEFCSDFGCWVPTGADWSGMLAGIAKWISVFQY